MATTIEFKAFPKIPRLRRDMTVTEKLDGTNACVVVSSDGTSVGAQSRTRVITPENDNFGFARWVEDNSEDLLTLGPGHHYGEWWGKGIQRRYGQDRRRFSLFNVERWKEDRPACCDVVPILFQGGFDQVVIDDCLNRLRKEGSVAAPGFMQPEGVVVFLHSSGSMYKVTLDNDAVPKGQSSE